MRSPSLTSFTRGLERAFVWWTHRRRPRLPRPMELVLLLVLLEGRLRVRQRARSSLLSAANGSVVSPAFSTASPSSIRSDPSTERLRVAMGCLLLEPAGRLSRAHASRRACTRQQSHCHRQWRLYPPRPSAQRRLSPPRRGSVRARRRDRHRQQPPCCASLCPSLRLFPFGCVLSAHGCISGSGGTPSAPTQPHCKPLLSASAIAIGGSRGLRRRPVVARRSGEPRWRLAHWATRSCYRASLQSSLYCHCRGPHRV